MAMVHTVARRSFYLVSHNTVVKNLRQELPHQVQEETEEEINLQSGNRQMQSSLPRAQHPPVIQVSDFFAQKVLEHKVPSLQLGCYLL